MEQVLPSDRVLTVPNLLSAIRLLLIPVFIYVLLSAHAYGWAVAILMFSGASDWADGKIARTLNQSSRLGVLLDPAVDRLYMVAVPVVLALAGIVPWWFVITPAAESRTVGAAGDLHRQSRDLCPDVGLSVGSAGQVGCIVEPGHRRLRLGLLDLGHVCVSLGVRALCRADHVGHAPTAQGQTAASPAKGW
jgi:hypothetical protein